MTVFKFYKDYKHNEELRTSFNSLATIVFGINFEEWYQKGYWNQRYIPYSFVDEGKVIANVSVNLLDFVIEGETKRAIQIGTVMTHPDYRNRGLSAKLMNQVLVEYEKQYDFMYLFANQTVLDFYPKFGFQQTNEVQFSIDYTPSNGNEFGLQKLDGSNKDHLDFIYKIASERVPVSSRFGTANTEGLLMFYSIYVFSKDIYYVEDEEAIVIFIKEGEQVNIYDIISRGVVNLETILSKITDNETNRIVFHYNPDYPGIKTHSEMYRSNDVLFVRASDSQSFPSNIKHPITAIA
ncbi:GNAT family N-acetyltransferase [Ureibacillus manganicus]|uniref:GCN5 family acetyltransferase n=1 Tax=Ureibacillus manganicus DSM 26584 TaxID=1384049 RepID=A0A0A3I1M5_9BACL|nr:GNAT family N-acetyltransferase [Ureibacillus manganicus]KGR77375.1 GCN5 family acetyltransferase [Ureibacillus manganicus DSM 26584]